MGSKYLSGQCVKLAYLDPLMQVREFEVACGPQKFIYRTGQFVVEQIRAMAGRKVGFLEGQELVIASTHADKHMHQLFTGDLQSSRHVGIQFAGSNRTSFDHLSSSSSDVGGEGLLDLDVPSGDRGSHLLGGSARGLLGSGPQQRMHLGVGHNVGFGA